MLSSRLIFAHSHYSANQGEPSPAPSVPVLWPTQHWVSLMMLAAHNTGSVIHILGLVVCEDVWAGWELHCISQCCAVRSAGQPATTYLLLGSWLAECGSYGPFWDNTWKNMHISLSCAGVGQSNPTAELLLESSLKIRAAMHNLCDFFNCYSNRQRYPFVSIHKSVLCLCIRVLLFWNFLLNRAGTSCPRCCSPTQNSC